MNLWGRTGWLLFQSLPIIPQGSYQLRGPKLSWNVIPDTGQWSSPRRPSSTCRPWAPSRCSVFSFHYFCLFSTVCPCFLQKVVPLANLIVKETLTEEDVLTCQKTVYNLVDMERKNDPLPISTVGSRGKGPKRYLIRYGSKLHIHHPLITVREEQQPPVILLNNVPGSVPSFLPARDEQYRIMWNELETLVKTHAGATDRHQRVLDCIIACRSKPPEEEERKKRGRKREEREDRTEKNGSKETEDKSWQDSERSVRLD